MLQFLRKTEKKAKSVSEAKEAALAELGVPEDEAEIVVIDEGSKGFLGIGSKEAVVSAELKNPELFAAKKFLADIFASMNLDVTINAELTDEGEISINLEGEHMGIVIGKRGDTLDSLQYLTSLVVNKESEGYIKVVVDTENYREKRYNALIALSNRLAEKVTRTGRRHTLEPMNPYERRIIHANLQDNPEVTTRSVGEEPYRKVIIEPKNARPYHKRPYRHSSYESYNRSEDTTEE